MQKFLVFILCVLTFTAEAQKDKKLTDKTVSKASIAAHLKFLSSDALEGRDTPSKGQTVAAEYLRTQLELYGVKPLPEYPDYFQPVPMKTVKSPEKGTFTLDSTTFNMNDDFLIMSGEGIEWSGAFVRLPYATKEEIANADVKGKVIVCNAGDGSEAGPRQWFGMVREKRKLAQEAGAVAVIEFYQSPQIPWSLLVRYLSGDQVVLEEGKEDEEELPFFWINDPGREASKVFDATSSISLAVQPSVEEPFTVYNVVGYVEGSDATLKNDYIIYSAHYDHVGIGRADSTGDDIYNGTRDNAVGTVTVLEAAKNHATYPNKRSSLFIFFTGEEKGLLGSQYFADNSPVALQDIVYCFNSDNGGYNDTGLVTVTGLDRTTAYPQMVQAIEAYGLRAGDDANFKEQNLFDRSDNVSFARKGIPSPSFGLGVSAFDDAVLRTYHQPSDEFETIDMEYMYRFYSAYVFAGRLIANGKETPFWVEGDKYYEAGKSLYEK